MTTDLLGIRRLRVHSAILTIFVATAGSCTGSPEVVDDATDADSAEANDTTRRPRPEDTEVWEPIPPMVIPGDAGTPPSDAIVLFDGTDLRAWTARDGSAAGWRVEDGVLTVVPGSGSISTRQRFRDVQLHIEWRTPAAVSGEGQGRGNSGVFLMARYELQVLDSYDNRTYSNGQAGSIYKQHMPLVNASLAPGEWQSYDIVFTAPHFDADGTLSIPAYMTVFHNGVLVQNHVEIKGPMTYIGEPQYEAHADREPLMLQDHGNPVSYRNIWVREISEVRQQH